MRRNTKRLLKSETGGVLIMTGIAALWILVATLYDPATNKVWLHKALFSSLAWPLEIFKPMFPGDHESPSPDTPTPLAVLTTLLFDLFIFSLLSYVILRLVERLKERKPLALT